MKQYQFIIFDLDDTLIDNLENVKYAYRKMMEFMGKNYSEDGFQQWYHLDKNFWLDFYNGKIPVPYEKTDPNFVPYVQSLRYQLYFDNQISIEIALEINNIFLSSLKEIVIPISGAYETLNYLSSKYKIVVATNGPAQAVKEKLDKINCLKFVSYIFSADMTKEKVTKPSKIYFEELKQYLNYYDVDKMLIVGDSLHSDVLGGMNAEIDSCWLNSQEEKITDEYQPTMVIKELKELIKKL